MIGALSEDHLCVLVLVKRKGRVADLGNRPA